MSSFDASNKHRIHNDQKAARGDVSDKDVQSKPNCYQSSLARNVRPLSK